MIDTAYPVVQTGTDTFRPRVVKLPRAHHLVDFYAGDVHGASKPPLVNALDWITDVFFIAALALSGAAAAGRLDDSVRESAAREAELQREYADLLAARGSA